MTEEELLESGMDAFNNGNFPIAVDLLQQALPLLRLADKPRELGLCIYTLECAKGITEDRQFHKETIEEALGLFQQTGLHFLAASCCTGLAEIVVAEAPAEARHFLDAARTHYEQCDNWTGPARVSRLEAKFAIDRGDKDEALRLLNDALRLIDEQPRGLESVKAERRQIEALKSRI